MDFPTKADVGPPMPQADLTDGCNGSRADPNLIPESGHRRGVEFIDLAQPLVDNPGDGPNPSARRRR